MTLRSHCQKPDRDNRVAPDPKGRRHEQEHRQDHHCLRPRLRTHPRILLRSRTRSDYIAYTFLGIDRLDIEHITADVIYEDVNFFFEVEIETKNSYDEYHVVINAYNAQVVTWWVE